VNFSPYTYRQLLEKSFLMEESILITIVPQMLVVLCISYPVRWEFKMVHILPSLTMLAGSVVLLWSECNATISSVGASVTEVDAYFPPMVFSRTYRNSLCLLQYSDPTTDLTTLEPNEVCLYMHTVNMLFVLFYRHLLILWATKLLVDIICLLLDWCSAPGSQAFQMSR